MGERLLFLSLVNSRCDFMVVYIGPWMLQSSFYSKKNPGGYSVVYSGNYLS